MAHCKKKVSVWWFSSFLENILARQGAEERPFIPGSWRAEELIGRADRKFEEHRLHALCKHEFGCLHPCTWGNLSAAGLVLKVCKGPCT